MSIIAWRQKPRDAMPSEGHGTRMVPGCAHLYGGVARKTWKKKILIGNAGWRRGRAQRFILGSLYRPVGVLLPEAYYQTRRRPPYHIVKHKTRHILLRLPPVGVGLGWR